MNFKAVMFDFDGTITKKGVAYPSRKMIDILVKLALKVPIAFCTGRQLDSFERYAMGDFLKNISPGDKNIFLKNLFLIAENGSIGYFFDLELNDFKEFYRAKWPGEFIEKEKLKQILQKGVEDFAEILDVHSIVLVTTAYDHRNIPVDKLYACSDKIFVIYKKILASINPDYEKYLHLGNSGIGVLVIPANWDKDAGIREFAKYLKKNRGIDFGEDARKILVIGDSAQKGGNDYYFLKGKYGTPYTVGYYDKSKEFPKAVVDTDGNRLFHEDGTMHLLKSFFDFLS